MKAHDGRGECLVGYDNKICSHIRKHTWTLMLFSVQRNKAERKRIDCRERYLFFIERQKTIFKSSIYRK